MQVRKKSYFIDWSIITVNVAICSVKERFKPPWKQFTISREPNKKNTKEKELKLS
jgi:hypothetical protein